MPADEIPKSETLTAFGWLIRQAVTPSSRNRSRLSGVTPPVTGRKIFTATRWSSPGGVARETRPHPPRADLVFELVLFVENGSRQDVRERVEDRIRALLRAKKLFAPPHELV